MDQIVRAEKIVLTLAESEFPGRSLPKEYDDLQDRGLEILWVAKNSRSYKKLLPIAEKYPGFDIVTADDDILYPDNTLESLLLRKMEGKRLICGHRGWQVGALSGSLLPYQLWSRSAGAASGARVFLTSGAGVFFPADFLLSKTLSDVRLAMELCPTADDIWFWAVSLFEGWTPCCLGNHIVQPLYSQARTPELHKTNVAGGGNDSQLLKVIEHFGLHGKLGLNS